MKQEFLIWAYQRLFKVVGHFDLCVIVTVVRPSPQRARNQPETSCAH